MVRLAGQVQEPAVTQMAMAPPTAYVSLPLIHPVMVSRIQGRFA